MSCATGRVIGCVISGSRSLAQLSDGEERKHGAEDAGAGEGDHRIVVAGPVVEETADPGAERGADAVADADRAEDRRRRGAAEHLQRDRRDEGAALAEHAAEAGNEAAEEKDVREMAEEP